MRRRELLAVGAAAAIAGCSSEPGDCGPAGPGSAGQQFNWKMVTTWPPNFPGLGTGVLKLVEMIEAASGGRLKIKVYAAGELVPAFEVFDAVSGGSAEMGHGSAYYWKGKTEAAQFFTSIPFGMTSTEMNGWMYFGGGLELYRELYQRFNLMPFPAGNTGVQMGGWFNRPVDSLKDLQGLKMRIPGLGGEVLRLAGGTPVNLPGADIFTALQTGAIDATEWIGPYNDVAFGLHKAARYYYYPGWQEPGPTLECIVNRDAYATLTEDLQAIVSTACSAVNDQMTAEFMARNAQSLEKLRREGEVDIRPFPSEVLRELSRLTDQVIAELVERDADARRIHESFARFRESVGDWSAISERAMLNTREV